MGTTSSGYYESERHEDSIPLKKVCDECRESFPMKAVFFPAEWIKDGMVCGACFEDNMQAIIDEEGLETFAQRFKTEQTDSSHRLLLSLETNN